MVILILLPCISPCKFGFHSTSVERVDYAMLIWTPSPHLNIFFSFFGLGLVGILVEICDYLQAKFRMNICWRVEKSSIHSLKYCKCLYIITLNFDGERQM